MLGYLDNFEYILINGGPLKPFIAWYLLSLAVISFGIE